MRLAWGIAAGLGLTLLMGAWSDGSLPTSGDLEIGTGYSIAVFNAADDVVRGTFDAVSNAACE